LSGSWAGLSEKELLAAGRVRRPAEARALIALKTQVASLTTLAHTFERDLFTLGHAVSRIEEHSRDSPAFAKTLNNLLYAISQA